MVTFCLGNVTESQRLLLRTSRVIDGYRDTELGEVYKSIVRLEAMRYCDIVTHPKRFLDHPSVTALG
jgi:hypothetical protein